MFDLRERLYDSLSEAAWDDQKSKYFFVGHVLCGIRRGSTYGLPVFGLHHANRRLHLHHHFLITLR